jgi:hypothetical protein
MTEMRRALIGPMLVALFALAVVSGLATPMAHASDWGHSVCVGDSYVIQYGMGALGFAVGTAVGTPLLGVAGAAMGLAAGNMINMAIPCN